MSRKRAENEPTTGARSIERLHLAAVTGPAIATISVAPGGAALIGRSRSCDHCLLDASVSREHARVSGAEGEWRIEDAGSRHGTFVNGARLVSGEPRVLSAGDEVSIGPWTLRVVVGGSEPGSLGKPSTLAGTVARVVPDARGEVVERLDEASLGELARHRLGVLIDCAGVIHGAASEQALAASLVESAISGTGYGRAALLRPGRGFSSGDFGRATADVQVLAAMVRGASGTGGMSTPSFPVSASLIAEAAAGRPARLGGVSVMGGVAGGGLSDGGAAALDYGRSIVDLRIHSALCVPIEVGETIEAFLYLDARGGEVGVQSDAAEFCVALARIGGLAMANLHRAALERGKRAIEAQLGAAREAQQMIVPPPAGTVAGLRYALRMRPGMVVAGDLFDILELPDGRAAFFLGDVTGEGVSAGILMAGAQSYLHAALMQHAEPAAAVNALNFYLASHTPVDRFISLWVGVLDKADRTLTYVDAGHGYWVHKPRGEKPRMVKTGAAGIPAAIDPDVTYRASTLAFGPGDRLILFSDGVVEQTRAVSDHMTMAGDGQSVRPRRDDFGLTRVLDVLGRCTTPDQDTRRVLAAVLEHAGTEALADDTSIASVEWVDDGAGASDAGVEGAGAVSAG